jgi:hypothetical protein
MSTDYFLDVGQRGLLLGKTGSGKTQDAIYQLKNPPVFPVIIFDTKIEDAFFSVPEDDDTMEVVNSYSDFVKLSKKPKNEIPDYILVRPEVYEVVDVDELDKYSQLVFHKFGKCFVYYDEMYNWHNNGKCGAGVLSLLTRGRSKGKTTLMASQRPSWLSRFCFTECEKFYIHRLTDERDKKTLDSIITDYSKTKNPLPFHFHHFEIGKHDEPILYKPVPETKIVESKIFSKKWV